MEKYFTIPNFLSASRLLLFPVLIWFAYSGDRAVFSWLLLASLVSDIADGFIARRFNMVTEFGSKLDSWGDLGNYIAALFGIIMLCWPDVASHYTGFAILFVLYFAGVALMLLKFGKLIGMHLYISKITGYVHGFFILSWFMFGFNTPFYYVAVLIGCYAFVEEIVLIILLKQPDQDLKSLYSVLKNRKELLHKSDGSEN